MDIYSGVVVHSSNYRNPEAYSGRRVLVIGFGNSGGEIALDLANSGVDVTLAVRSPVQIMPRDLLGFLRQARFFLDRQPIKMPAYQGHVTEAEVGELLAYIGWVRQHPY